MVEKEWIKHSYLQLVTRVTSAKVTAACCPLVRIHRDSVVAPPSIQSPCSQNFPLNSSIDFYVLLSAAVYLVSRMAVLYILVQGCKAMGRAI